MKPDPEFGGRWLATTDASDAILSGATPAEAVSELCENVSELRLLLEREQLNRAEQAAKLVVSYSRRRIPLPTRPKTDEEDAAANLAKFLIVVVVFVVGVFALFILGLVLLRTSITRW